MGWSRKQNPSPNDPDAGDANDPLADNMRLRPRRSAGATQPMGSDPGGSIHDQNTVVDSGNFSSRSRMRRERQLSSPFSTQRLGSWAADPENSQKLLMIGGAVVAFLLLIAFISIASRFYNTGAPTDDTATDASPSASAEIGGIEVGPPASADTGSVPQPATNIPGTDPGQQPVAPSGGAFTVTGTGTEGLFLRQDHNTGANIIGTLPEGTRIDSLGETFNDGTRDWLRVNTPLGEGWVAQQFLTPAQ
ncbi:MAG TPA: SH3 domain-containing protein [Herpetosiphonaceae bacterium]